MSERESVCESETRVVRTRETERSELGDLLKPCDKLQKPVVQRISKHPSNACALMSVDTSVHVYPSHSAPMRTKRAGGGYRCTCQQACA